MSDPRESPNATAKIGDLRNMAKVYDRVMREYAIARK